MTEIMSGLTTGPRIVTAEEALRERLRQAEKHARTSKEAFRFLHPTSAAYAFIAGAHRVVVEIPGALLPAVRQLDRTDSVTVLEESRPAEIRFENHVFVTSDPDVAAVVRERLVAKGVVREIPAPESSQEPRPGPLDASEQVENPVSHPDTTTGGPS